MANPVPELHRDLLEKEVLSVLAGDREHVLRMMDGKKDIYKPHGRKLIDTMIEQVHALHDMLAAEHESLSSREHDVAVAALKYFLRTNDLVSDDSTAGLVDDSLVVQAACNELKERMRTV